MASERKKFEEPTFKPKIDPKSEVRDEREGPLCLEGAAGTFQGSSSISLDTPTPSRDAGAGQSAARGDAHPRPRKSVRDRRRHPEEAGGQAGRDAGGQTPGTLVAGNCHGVVFSNMRFWRVPGQGWESRGAACDLLSHLVVTIDKSITC